MKRTNRLQARRRKESYKYDPNMVKVVNKKGDKKGDKKGNKR